MTLSVRDLAVGAWLPYGRPTLAVLCAIFGLYAVCVAVRERLAPLQRQTLTLRIVIGSAFAILGASRSMPVVVMPAWWLLLVFLFVDIGIFASTLWIWQLYCGLCVEEIDGKAADSREADDARRWYQRYGNTWLLLVVLVLVSGVLFTAQLSHTLSVAPETLRDGSPCAPLWELWDVPYHRYLTEPIQRFNSGVATAFGLGPFVTSLTLFVGAIGQNRSWLSSCADPAILAVMILVNSVCSAVTVVRHGSFENAIDGGFPIELINLALFAACEALTFGRKLYTAFCPSSASLKSPAVAMQAVGGAACVASPHSAAACVSRSVIDDSDDNSADNDDCIDGRRRIDDYSNDGGGSDAGDSSTCSLSDDELDDDDVDDDHDNGDADEVAYRADWSPNKRYEAERLRVATSRVAASVAQLAAVHAAPAATHSLTSLVGTATNVSATHAARTLRALLALLPVVSDSAASAARRPSNSSSSSNSSNTSGVDGPVPCVSRVAGGGVASSSDSCVPVPAERALAR
eukprot:TRINITY_DN778_c0_g3_i2.p1 TRINITY_DN778_c0_g3~~TRINITY_DN778_c0_g3_i2.p1  ORF type:complete len:551 (-),score=271.06 TRINITY_DN778_c0_g3_i2:113-1663(-)